MLVHLQRVRRSLFRKYVIHVYHPPTLPAANHIIKPPNVVSEASRLCTWLASRRAALDYGQSPILARGMLSSIQFMQTNDNTGVVRSRWSLSAGNSAHCRSDVLRLLRDDQSIDLRLPTIQLNIQLQTNATGRGGGGGSL